MSLTPEVIRGRELTLDTFYAALGSIVPAATVMTVGGKSFTQPELLAKVDSVRAPYKAKRTAKTELKKTQEELKTALPDITSFVKALHTAVTAYLGEGNPDIVKFGFLPNKPRKPLTAEAAQARAAKARKTRARNHTMGKRQKKALAAEASPDAAPNGNGSSSPSANGGGTSGPSPVPGGASHVA